MALCVAMLRTSGGSGSGAVAVHGPETRQERIGDGGETPSTEGMVRGFLVHGEKRGGDRC
jgi:hypothetical protein